MKHAQCFDVALMDEGSVVLASKDYRIYVYRYLMTSLSTGSGTVNGDNVTLPSPMSSLSTTPNSSQMMNGECTSSSFINSHDETASSITNNRC